MEMNSALRNSFVALAAVAALAGCGKREEHLASPPATPTSVSAIYAFQSGSVDRMVDCETGNTVYRYNGVAATEATSISAPALRQICTRAGIMPGF